MKGIPKLLATAIKRFNFINVDVVTRMRYLLKVIILKFGIFEFVFG